jgi:hypothetical protein
MTMSEPSTEIYLTNGSAEDVLSHQMDHKGVQVDLKALGLESQEDYPLSEQEANYVFDDEIVLQGIPGPFGQTPTYNVLMGYSTLKDGVKFLAPTIEHMYGDGDDADKALRDVNAFADATRPALEAIGGSVTVVEDALPSRHNVEIRIPMEYAVSTGLDYDGWVEHLKTKVLAMPQPVQAPTP